MNKRRIIRKVLRPKLVLLYIIVIALSVVLCNFLFGGMKVSALDVTKDNLKYDLSEFKDINLELENETWGSKEDIQELKDYVTNGLASSNKSEAELTQEFYELYSERPGVQIAKNEKFVMYFNKLSTIATVYEIEEAAKNPDGTIDISKCKRYYSTAVPGVSNKAAAIEVSYLDAKTGKAVNSTINSVSGSTNYMNTLTSEYEKHYSLKFGDNGVQIAYQIGEFSAGSAYFPEYFFATIYKPELSSFVTKEGEIDEKAYNERMEYWEEYMAVLGLPNASEASYEEYMAALSCTFEEMFRGTMEVNMKTTPNASKTEATVTFGSSVKIYTREAFEYAKGLVDKGVFGDMAYYDEDKIETGNGTSTTTKNVYWTIYNVDSSFFYEGEGVYFNCEESPLTFNLNLIGDAYKQITDNYKLSGPIGDRKYPHYDMDIKGDVVRMQAYNLFYNEIHFTHYLYDYTYFDEFGNPLMQGGMFEFDKNGRRVYDENGVAKTTHMTLAMASDFNAMFDVETTSSLPIFSMVLDLRLEKDGLVATVLGDSFVDASNAKEKKVIVIGENDISQMNDRYELSGIKVLPYMTYFDNSLLSEKETGMIVVPDGSGALINFNNGKSNMLATAVNSSYYGNDMTYTTTYIEEETMDLMLGMYGFIYTTPSNPRGVLAVLEKGGNQVSLFANTNDNEANAYFSCKVREFKDIRIGTSATSTPFTKWSYNMCDTDFKFRYIFLNENEADYVSLANKYRDYLIERDGLVDKDDTKDTVVDLNFLGSFEKYALFLGFKYKTPDTLTTFNQAKEIIDELSDKVKEFNVSYTSWTNEEMEYQLGDSIKVSRQLGGKKGMVEFSSYLDNLGIDLYLETYVSTTLDYDLSFGNLKYTTRNIANETAIRYQFDLATQRVNKKVAATYVLRPDYYTTVAKSLVEKINKLNITKNDVNDKKNGYYLVDLGSLTACHYGKDAEIYGDAAIQYQKDALATIAEGNKLKIKAPYDYAIKYADIITDAPLTSTQRQIYDETIPLYQLVINGLVDYTCETINGTSNKGSQWFFAKALETGSNLSFQLSYENPTVLLDTDYTYYYQSYYKNWKENILSMASNIDNLGIHNGRLVYHKNIGKNVADVKYLLENGTYVELLVNTTVNDYNYYGQIIPAYSFVRIQ